MVNVSFRKLLIGSVVGSCSFGTGLAVWAQSAPVSAPAPVPAATGTPAPDVTAPAAWLENVTVTARKKEESLQSVPESISVLTKKDLENARVENLADVARLTPGVSVTDNGSEYGTSITIRGITDETFGVSPPSTATYLDGVYLRDPQVINLTGASLERIEIVKGPVSALYGQTAYAGAINYVTERPTSNDMHGSLEQTFGNDGRFQTNASVSAGLVPDKVFLKLFGTYDTFNGFDHTPVTNFSGGAYDKKDVGALLDVHINDNITTQFNFYYGYDQFGQSDIVRITPNCGFNPAVNALTQYCGTVNTKGAFYDTNDDPRAGATGNTRLVELASMKNTFAYDWGKIDSITAATFTKEAQFNVFDSSPNGIPFPLTNGTTILEHGYYGGSSLTTNFSQELRYTSPQDRRLRYGGGIFFYDENRLVGSAAGLATIGIPPGVTFAASACFGLCSTWATPYGEIGNNYNEAKTSTIEKAGFLNAEYDILPDLTFATQYRYTLYDDSFVTVKNQYTPVLYPYGSRITQTGQYSNINEALRWKILPNVMTYVAFATGVKPGGFNGASSVVEDQAFGPETDQSIEIGAKTNFLQNRLQIDAAVYHIASQNVQAYAPSSDPTNAAEVIKNFGATTTWGAELGVRAKPIPSTTLDFGASYNHATFNSNTFDLADAGECAAVPSCAATLVHNHGPNAAVPISGNYVPYAPQLTLSTGAEYDFTVMEKYDGFVRADYTLKSKIYSNPVNLTSIGVANQVDLNAVITYKNYSIGAFIKNLANDRTPTFFEYEVQLDYFQKVPAAVLPPGRLFGGVVALKF